MKNIFKLFGIVVIVAVMGFSFAACGEEDVQEISGTVTAEYSSYDGVAVVFFIYSGSVPCTITTDMDAPNDRFILNSNDPTTSGRICGPLTVGQTVKWTAKVDSGKISAQVSGYQVSIKIPARSIISE